MATIAIMTTPTTTSTTATATVLRMLAFISDDGFEDEYDAPTKTPKSFKFFVSVFVVVCVCMAGPGINCWIRRRLGCVRRRQKRKHDSNSTENISHDGGGTNGQSVSMIGDHPLTEQRPASASQELIEIRLDRHHYPIQQQNHKQNHHLSTTATSDVHVHYPEKNLVDHDLLVDLMDQQQESSPYAIKKSFQHVDGSPLPAENLVYRAVNGTDNSYQFNQQQLHQQHQLEQQIPTLPPNPHPVRSTKPPEAQGNSIVQVSLIPSAVNTTNFVSRSLNERILIRQRQQQAVTHPETGGDGGDTNTNIALSAVPSAATTSRLYDSRSLVNKKRRSTKSFVLWSRGKPLSRKEILQRSVEQERFYVQRLIGPPEAPVGEGSVINSARTGNENYNPHRAGHFSDAAGSILQGRSVLLEGEAEYYRKKFVRRKSESPKNKNNKDNNENAGNANNNNNTATVTERRRRPSMVGGGEDASVVESDNFSQMPPLSPDILSPSDAASNDPGRPGIPVSYEQYLARLERDREEHLFLDEPGDNPFSSLMVNLLDLAETDHETKRILSLAAPSTLGTVADPLFRLILIGLIAQLVSNNSMVAYVLVILFIRLTTEELAGAITDAESNMVQDALMLGGESGYYQAGQFIQLAIIMQLLIGIPVLVVWVLLMYDLVYWLVGDADIAEKASNYTSVIIIDYILTGASKTFMLPFYLTGQAQFESTMDLITTMITIAAIGFVVGNGSKSVSKLSAIGWIQVIFGIAKTITKVAYVFLKGWVDPYKKGLFEKFSLKDKAAVKIFLLQALPQFLGSLIELGEWETLIFFVQHMGGAQVATWAVMGVIWEVFVALSEGLGEAASVRISFYLTEGMPSDAKKLSYKVSFFGFLHVLLVTSLFLVLGQNIAYWLTSDKVLQHMLNDLVGMTGLANVAMTVAQIYWSIAGAQGRFELASATILICRWFIILPCAALLVFHKEFEYDTVSVAGIVAAGYAAASLYLSCKVFRADWDELSRSLQEQEEPPNDGLQCEEVEPPLRVEDADNSSEEESEDETSSYHESTVINHEVV